MGFFALIESEVTDGYGHKNSIAGVIDAVAAAVATSFLENPGARARLERL